VRIFDARDDWRETQLYGATHVEWEQLKKEAKWNGRDLRTHFLTYMHVATRLDLTALMSRDVLDLEKLEEQQRDDAHILLVGSSGRGGARFEEEVGSLYDMMVTELNCRNVAIIEGGFDALAACLRTQDYGHLLLNNPEPKEWTAETMSAVLKPLWAQALSLVYGDKKDAAGKGSDVQLWIPEGLAGPAWLSSATTPSSWTAGWQSASSSPALSEHSVS
jgi:hypothetical protein